MRLSDVKGERTLDVVAEIIEPIANIAEDENAMALFNRGEVPEGMSPEEHFFKRVKRAVPSLVKTHRNDLICILAAIEGVEPNVYAESMSLQKLIKDIFELITDTEFKSFLSSFGKNADEEPSGLPSETTEEPEVSVPSTDTQ